MQRKKVVKGNAALRAVADVGSRNGANVGVRRQP